MTHNFEGLWMEKCTVARWESKTEPRRIMHIGVGKDVASWGQEGKENRENFWKVAGLA
jgi:hypothetical protein